MVKKTIGKYNPLDTTTNYIKNLRIFFKRCEEFKMILKIKHGNKIHGYIKKPDFFQSQAL